MTMSEGPAAAEAAGLRYVSDRQPGIRRQRRGGGFRYVGPRGAVVDEEETLRRIRALVIPPAWTDVWISPDARAHLQATGRDARGRKQYRYHPEWTAVRDETKFERMIAFGEALPAIRARVDADLALPGMPREKVLATVVRLLDRTLIRVGNDEYARQNHSYGLTTLRDNHVDVDGSHIRFHFRGKSGKVHRIDLQDKRLAKIVRRCQEIPGHELFHYIDADGNTHLVESGDVNDYLRDISGEDFTAKHFRTWAGSVLAASALSAGRPWSSQTQAKKQLVSAIRGVADKLGNTPAVCRKCYIHPIVIDGFLRQRGSRRARSRMAPVAGLDADEIRLLSTLRRQAAPLRERSAARRARGNEATRPRRAVVRGRPGRGARPARATSRGSQSVVSQAVKM
jgi:DNA topoisomerase-1